MLIDLFEATYYIIDNQFMRDYLHRLFSDMIDVLSRLTAVEHVPIRIEIHKHPRFNYFFYTYINEQVSPGIRSLFMNRRFSFSYFLVSFLRLMRRTLYAFFRIQMRYPAVSFTRMPEYSHGMFWEYIR